MKIIAKISCLFATGMSLILLSGCNREPTAWQEATSADTAHAYESYLKEYPVGAHAEEARQRQAASIERQDLSSALSVNTIESLEALLTKHKGSAGRKDVQEALDRLYEERDWASISASRDVKRLTEFVQRYPASAHKEEAMVFIERKLRWQKALNQGKARNELSISCSKGFLYNASPRFNDTRRNGATVEVSGSMTITDDADETLTVRFAGIVWSKNEKLQDSYFYSYDTEIGESDLTPFEGCLSQPSLDKTRPVALFRQTSQGLVFVP